MKTNMEYLREFIKDNTEAIEFWDAASKEIEERDDEIEELKDTITNKDEVISNLECELNENLIDEDGLEEIDCGIGLIKYLQPDNLKLQCYMDEFKEKTEKIF